MTEPTIADSQREDLAAIDTLLDAGQRDIARRAARRLMEEAEATAPESAEELRRVVAAAELARDQAWEPARQAERWVAPTNFRHRRTTPRRPIPGPRHEGDALAAVYLAERGGVDDSPERAEPSEGYTIDYDRAAVPALRGQVCLVCRLERSSADRARRDGLCRDCTDDGHTRQSWIEDRCAQTATQPDGAHRLRRAWLAANTADKATIAGWVAAHPIAHPDLKATR